MGKFHGKIGYAVNVEKKPGVWVEEIEERTAFGDWITNTAKIQEQSNINGDLQIANDLSIVADPYARKNFHAIRYATYMGTQWRVRMVKEAYPRLVLSLGGVYNDADGSQSS